MFYDDSTLIFSTCNRLGESYYITCPVCWNSSIRVIQWEDGSVETRECVTCKRTEEIMELEELVSR